MISKRNYFSILLIFIATLLLFQGMQAGKKYLNDYNVNDHTGDSGLVQENVWTAPMISDPSFAAAEELRHKGILYVGDGNSVSVRAAQEWAQYAKRAFLRVDALDETPPGTLPGLVLVHGSVLEDNLQALEAWCEAGATVLCLGLPEPRTVSENEKLKKLLGIRSVWQNTVHLDGVHLFPGFFLGGEHIYQAETPEDQDKQDLELDVPWYIVRTGTKTYMRGILTEEDQALAETQELENEDGPALIWRNAYRKGFVYAVNGTYCANRKILMGLCAAVLSQGNEILLYPVVNAQVVSVLNFPACANENSETVRGIYGMDQVGLESNIILPSLISLSSRYGIKLSMFMTPQMDYEDGIEPEPKQSHTFMGQINEIGSEGAVGTQTRGETPLREKLDRDAAYYRAEGLNYVFSAVSAMGSRFAELGDVLDSPLLSGLRTVLMGKIDDRSLFGYLSGDISFQRVTSYAETHTYRVDLEMLCLETALGYGNTCFDMEHVFWPEDEQDQWQNVSKHVFSNLASYNSAYTEIRSVTISESDQRIRRFLALDYKEQLEGDTLHVEIDDFSGEAWFILRCFQKEVAEAAGGKVIDLENGTWLIRADEKALDLKMRQAEVLYNR